MLDWRGKQVTILGLSKSGFAAARYLAQHGAQCFLSETMPATAQNEAMRQALQELGIEFEMGGHTQTCFTHGEYVILSPGIPPGSPVVQQLLLSGKTLISEVELAGMQTQIPLIGITGTNGKTTTTSLISAILEASGLKAPVCGNIGIPVIDTIETQSDYLVAELSSYQIEFSPNLTPKIAIFTNFTPDHLDWHGSLEAYKRSKFKLFQPNPEGKSPEWIILNAKDKACQELAPTCKSPILWFSTDIELLQGVETGLGMVNGFVCMKQSGQWLDPLFSIENRQLVGDHNVENILAATAAAILLNIAPASIQKAVDSFHAVSHRLERVKAFGELQYYNDSKATNPEAAICALQAFSPQKVVLIAGGRDKMGPLADFVLAVRQAAVHVVLIGEASARFKHALEEDGYTAISQAASLKEAIVLATERATINTPILFSPACASFDIFKNYEERGAYFKTAVIDFTTFPQTTRTNV
jgi:UDP-N-acetylmuramoylalanine--D-glutamate ligase